MINMKRFLKIVLVLPSLAMSNLTFAEEIATKVGFGLFRSAEHSITEVKTMSWSYEQRIMEPMSYQFDVGFFTDSIGDGRRGSLFTSLALGTEVYTANNLDIKVFFGPCLISNPDTYLGGAFQFNTDIIVGFKDPNTDVFIGLNYKHISSGGLELPNVGRDFIMLRTSFPFYFEWEK